MVGIVLTLSLLGILAVGKDFTNPIILMSKEIEKIAQYNLTSNNNILNKLLTRKDKIGNIASSVSLLQQNLTELIRDISRTSHTVATSSIQLSTASEESTLALNEVTKAMDEIANSSDHILEIHKSRIIS